MKKIILVLLLPLFLSCAGYFMGTQLKGSQYIYYYALEKPKTSEMFFSDSTIAIGFSISKASINFRLKNLANEPLKIIWDEASIVQFGEAKKIMHSGIKYVDRNSPQTPTTVPPGVEINDLVIPTENIYYLSGQYGGWQEHDLFPTTDLGKEEFKTSILNSKGRSFSLYLPISVKGNTVYYSFEFTITDVQEIEK